MTRSGKSRSTKKSSAPSATTRNLRLQFATVAAAALIVHGLCLGAPFYMDDQGHLLKSQRIAIREPFRYEKPRMTEGHKMHVNFRDSRGHEFDRSEEEAL